MVFKLARKTIFVLILNLILSFNLIVIMCLFFFSGYNQSLWRKSNFALFSIFNYVIYITPHPLNNFIGSFWSYRKKPSFQYHLVCN